MHKLTVLLVLTGFVTSLSVLAADKDRENRCYELRTYYAAPGKLEELHARFRDHTCALFEKHGISNLGYWVPLDNPENKLLYVLAYPSREAREKSWRSSGRLFCRRRCRRESRREPPAEGGEHAR
jgi:hypothetical protein